MISDPTVTVLICEAPSGYRTVRDGALLGVAAFSVGPSAVTSTDSGASNPVKGAVRILAVRTDFHGLVLGQRLLKKVEAKMEEEGCVGVAMCVVEKRESMCR